MRHKKHAGGHENHERWLLTYADMITLLVAFFIMLYAMSIVNPTKFQVLSLSVRSGFAGNDKLQAIELQPGLGIAQSNAIMSTQHIAKQDFHFEASTHTASQEHKQRPDTELKSADSNHATPGAVQKSANVDERNMEEIRRMIEDAARRHGLQKVIQVGEDQRGLTIRILTDNLLFTKGDGHLRPQSDWLLDVVSKAVRPLPNDVIVEGHTDDLPIHTALYPSNWELSTARATNVLRYMVEDQGLPAQRISCAGYAYTHPLVPNSSEANRARNRRVDIVVVRMADSSSTDGD